VELRQYAAILWRWMWLIVLLTLLAGGTAFVVSRGMTPIYSASATLMISEASGPTTDYTSILTSERLARTYSELLKKRPVLEEVVSNLGLALEWEELEELAEDIEVTLVRDTQLIELSVEHPDPAMAKRLADEIPRVFIRRNEEMQASRFSASKASLALELERMAADIQATEESIAALRESSSAADQAERTSLEANLAQYRSSYSNVLKSYEEIRLAEAKAVDNVVVVEPARLPEEPVRPRTLLNTALAAVVGLMLAVGTVFLIEYLDDTVKSEEDVAEAMNLGVLGAIGRIPGGRPDEMLVTVGGSRSLVAEAYRVLRTNLQFCDVDHPIKTLLVTSPGPVEGKSTTVANLAAVMAQAGSSVIVVDSDLRRPMMSEIFLLDGQRGGVTSALMGDQDAPLDGYLQATVVEGLRVLTSGPRPPNPSELLGSGRMKQLIERLKEEADIVLFDTPPALVASDAAVLATQLDGVLMVVDAGATRRDMAARGVESLRQVGARVYGAVLNQVSRRQGGYYYYYDHYYSDDEENGKGKVRRQGSRRGRFLSQVARWLGLDKGRSSRRH